jgi:hypothetical protein
MPLQIPNHRERYRVVGQRCSDVLLWRGDVVSAAAGFGDGGADAAGDRMRCSHNAAQADTVLD